MGKVSLSVIDFDNKDYKSNYAIYSFIATNRQVTHHLSHLLGFRF